MIKTDLTSGSADVTVTTPNGFKDKSLIMMMMFAFKLGIVKTEESLGVWQSKF